MGSGPRGDSGMTEVWMPGPMQVETLLVKANALGRPVWVRRRRDMVSAVFVSHENKGVGRYSVLTSDAIAFKL